MKKKVDNPAIFGIEPQKVWEAFSVLSTIPRGSSHEKPAIDWIRSVATQKGYSTESDLAGNLLVHLQSPNGQSKKIILQAHVDMVWEKNSHVIHDFNTDPIMLIREGDWICAKDTTLGADNGIGVAMMMALMDEWDRNCNIDLLFTVDEECGLTGALNLAPGMIQGDVLINLDGEEEGVFYIGCAGGQETHAEYPVTFQSPLDGASPWSLRVKGLKGGHSGADIHLQRGNSIKILARVLDACLDDSLLKNDLLVSAFDGGDKHNAIPREAFARIWINTALESRLHQLVLHIEGLIMKEFAADEPDFRLLLQRCEFSENADKELVFDRRTAKNLVSVLMTLPHGVQNMSRTIPGLVSTSCNLAKVHTVDGKIKIVTSQRSDHNSMRDHLSRAIYSLFTNYGFEVHMNNPYPAWTPQPRTELMEIAEKCWYRHRGGMPVMTAIHAGLECGVLGEKRPGLSMISFGPLIQDVHTPRERVSIQSVMMFWKYLKDFIVDWSKA